MKRPVIQKLFFDVTCKALTFVIQNHTKLEVSVILLICGHLSIMHIILQSGPKVTRYFLIANNF